MGTIISYNDRNCSNFMDKSKDKSTTEILTPGQVIEKYNKRIKELENIINKQQKQINNLICDLEAINLMYETPVQLSNYED
jgi:predicted RNase H-like nuclease (RuvC/YqgF family)